MIPRKYSVPLVACSKHGIYFTCIQSISSIGISGCLPPFHLPMGTPCWIRFYQNIQQDIPGFGVDQPTLESFSFPSVLKYSRVSNILFKMASLLPVFSSLYGWEENKQRYRLITFETSTPSIEGYFVWWAWDKVGLRMNQGQNGDSVTEIQAQSLRSY